MKGTATSSMGAKEWAMLLALSVLWGGSFFFFKILVEVLPPLTIVLGRVGFAALALNLLLLARREPMPGDPRVWGAFAVMGALNNIVPFTLIVFGETRISSGLAAILNATTPVFTVLVAHALTDSEKLTWQKSVGVLLGFAGVAILVGPSALSAAGGADVIGEAACLLAALSYAFAGVYGRRFKGQVSPLQVATGQITASTLVLVPITMVVDRPWTLPMPSVDAWLAFAGLSLPSTALAYILYFRILATAGATNLLLVTFLLPVSAMLLGVLVLHESVTASALAGMGVMGLGLAAIDGRPWAMVFGAPCPRADRSLGKDAAA